MAVHEPIEIIDSDNHAEGFIALFRSVRKHWLWKDAVRFQWWLDILLEVNYKDKKVLLGGVLLECKRGQSLNSLETWAKRWRVDKSMVRRFFKLLEKDDMIITENVGKTTRLTVCNYDSYNSKRHEDDTETTRTRHGNDTETTPNNKDNKDNKENKENKIEIELFPKEEQEQKNGFKKPTLQDVAAHAEKSFSLPADKANLIAENFVTFYQSKGWKIGKASMKDWKAAFKNSLDWDKNKKIINDGKHLTPIAGGSKSAGAEQAFASLQAKLNGYGINAAGAGNS